jgi:hypothetical protein
MYQFGKIGNSNIDYQSANSPDPTYFRKLPLIIARSMQETMGNTLVNSVPIMKMRKKQDSIFS